MGENGQRQTEEDPMAEVDTLFKLSELTIHDSTLLSAIQPTAQAPELIGLLTPKQIQKQLDQIKNLPVDEYIQNVCAPTAADKTHRPGAKQIIKNLALKIHSEVERGPLYCAVADLDFGNSIRSVGFITQERSSCNGVWMPQHHKEAGKMARRCERALRPIVFLMDTPGADAGSEANANNQAHSISELIAQCVGLRVPTVGVVIGQGYSGGAIPLASSNILLCVRDGIFNTIQPKGLQSIARKHDLSWQACAKSVGVSPAELLSQGCIDGVIDYSPVDRDEKIDNLFKAITSSIELIESSAKKAVLNTPKLQDFYQRCLHRYLNPPSYQQACQGISQLESSSEPATHFPNVFGVAYTYMRYIGLRQRLKSINQDDFGLLSTITTPQGDLKERQQREREKIFKSWLQAPDKIAYHQPLQQAWDNFLKTRAAREDERLTVLNWLLGEPNSNYEKALHKLLLEISLFLYNRWKNAAADSFKLLIHLLQDDQAIAVTERWPVADLTILDIVMHKVLRAEFITHCENILTFNSLYDNVVQNLGTVAKEALETKGLSRASTERLFTHALGNRDKPHSRKAFSHWLKYFLSRKETPQMLLKVEEWKSGGFSHLNRALFVILTYYFERLLPSYFASENNHKENKKIEYKGKIQPAHIGQRTDFWNNLDIGYQDLLIRNQLKSEKTINTPTVNRILKMFFIKAKETRRGRISNNPVNFPGFRQSIHDAIEKNTTTPCGLRTFTADYKKANGDRQRVGVAISNVGFQAGAWDQASTEKFCRLSIICAEQKLPIIGFISSAGMQTKEGAAALFSMPIMNFRLSRFILDNDLPVVMIAFGDCTGGAQASFVTHPLVHTYYASGTNMPFAGQMVVPDYLPSTSTLSNYLSQVPGAMTGLVANPFSPDMDSKLREIDPQIPIAQQSVDDAINNALAALPPTQVIEALKSEPVDNKTLMQNIKKVLIHARGCTAVKLIRIAHQQNLPVVLVASDPDMEAAPAKMLRPDQGDTLVCLGGNTSAESYLNAASVLKIAQSHQVDALHPGIGFLSEAPAFAELCVNYGINFIGPSHLTMSTMGNKSNAIQAVTQCGIAKVQGSDGVLTSLQHALDTAAVIGYPVLLKAAHGGGGKGIQQINKAAELEHYYEKVSFEARQAFGNGDLYMEQFIESMRHIEVQLLRDKFGTTKVLGIRDCTVQRNNQKVLEESGSVMLADTLKQQVLESTRTIADAVDYIGAGTVEFIYNLKDKICYFMEMNTRLQVEHPVTEATSGIDIVKAQFDIAAGKSIESLTPENKGYAIEVRITAEAIELNEQGEIQLIPSPGRFSECDMPQQDDIEIISIAATGCEISPYYDSLIAQVIMTGETREETINKLHHYLDQEVVLRGVPSNIPLLKAILTDPEFKAGHYDTGYLPRFLQRIDAKPLIQENQQNHQNTEEQNSRNGEGIRIPNSNKLKVRAPNKGVFYVARSPGEKPFVKVGDVIRKNDGLAIIEAMKIMQEVSLRRLSDNFDADQYKIEEVMLSDGQEVTKGDDLFIISPIVNTESASPTDRAKEIETPA
jgi:acetyl/propionyl-CoA carboxylase alpha subunit